MLLYLYVLCLITNNVLLWCYVWWSTLWVEWGGLSMLCLWSLGVSRWQSLAHAKSNLSPRLSVNSLQCSVNDKMMVYLFNVELCQKFSVHFTGYIYIYIYTVCLCTVQSFKFVSNSSFLPAKLIFLCHEVIS